MTADTTIAQDAAITAVTRWFDDIWSKQDMQAVDELLAPEFAYVLSFMQTSGRDTFKRILETNHGAFEHLPYVADAIILMATRPQRAGTCIPQSIGQPGTTSPPAATWRPFRV
ncbi:MAG: hypothetical protein ACLFVO_15960 [Chloroflexaceae bacterium]